MGMLCAVSSRGSNGIRRRFRHTMSSLQGATVGADAGVIGKLAEDSSLTPLPVARASSSRHRLSCPFCSHFANDFSFYRYASLAFQSPSMVSLIRSQASHPHPWRGRGMTTCKA